MASQDGAGKRLHHDVVKHKEMGLANNAFQVVDSQGWVVIGPGH